MPRASSLGQDSTHSAHAPTLRSEIDRATGGCPLRILRSPWFVSNLRVRLDTASRTSAITPMSMSIWHLHLHSHVHEHVHEHVHVHVGV